MPAKQKPKTRKTRKSPTVILKDQIKELNSNIDDQNEKYLRLKAEFDNYRKRKDLEIIDILKYDGESIIKEFLSIIDDLYRSKEAFSDNDKLDVDKMLEGIDLIISKINKIRISTSLKLALYSKHFTRNINLLLYYSLLF